jgi:hypothetical protein
MILAYENKCAMCGKDAIASEREKGGAATGNDSISSAIVEQINGTYYTFDTANCALMFKKFNAIYGSNFADE